jgi:hypothetical protein
MYESGDMVAGEIIDALAATVRDYCPQTWQKPV